VRDAEERQVWKRLGSRNARPELGNFDINGQTHDLSAPFVVVGGRNGAGKSRLLRSVAEEIGDQGLFLDLHHLSEQAMILLRSQTDVEELADEAGLYEPDAKRVEDLSRILGRTYSSVEWSELDLIPAEPEVANIFKWGGKQPTVPYFRVGHRDATYSGREMGLGEFTMHLLMWILEQYRSTENLTLLLDEPDAFLPPVGVQRLLRRLLLMCKERGWQLILTTHSEEMIRTAVDHDAFLLMYVDDAGQTRARAARDDRRIVAPLLTRPGVERVLFCEDEAAYYLIQSMLASSDAIEDGAVATAWGQGHGYIRELRKALPKPPRFDLAFTFVFDGDQWAEVDYVPQRWPVRFLPTGGDPDALFRGALDIDFLAGRVGASVSVVESYLSGIDGEEDHDWVNSLADHFGRPMTLKALADSWVGQNLDHSNAFVEQIASRDDILLHPTQVAIREALRLEEEQAALAGTSDQT
jgi:energy-coupling factor transporter ATP-binding protein EcfA2